METVSIGGASCSMNYALSYAKRYLNDHLSDEPDAGMWSYPAYDGYETATDGKVGDADLLAIVLLNAGRRPIPAYYGLKEMLPEINEHFADERLTGSLAEAGDETIEAIIDLYNLVNTAGAPQVRLTTLSKVLHRKMPDLLPLFDRNIRRCYVYRGDPPPLAPFKTNESRKFIAAWIRALRQDLIVGTRQWQQIVDLAPGPAISPLRAMDMVGWELGRRPRDYFTSAQD